MCLNSLHSPVRDSFSCSHFAQWASQAAIRASTSLSIWLKSIRLWLRSSFFRQRNLSSATISVNLGIAETLKSVSERLRNSSWGNFPSLTAPHRTSTSFSFKDVSCRLKSVKPGNPEWPRHCIKWLIQPGALTWFTYNSCSCERLSVFVVPSLRSSTSSRSVSFAVDRKLWLPKRFKLVSWGSCPALMAYPKLSTSFKETSWTVSTFNLANLQWSSGNRCWRSPCLYKLNTRLWRSGSLFCWTALARLKICFAEMDRSQKYALHWRYPAEDIFWNSCILSQEFQK